MYKDMTYEDIMARCLSRVSSSVDKREGSVIFDAIAPAAAELAVLYTTLSAQIDRAFPDTATGLDLTNKARERGIMRLSATYAVRRGVFTGASGEPLDIPPGSRFSGGRLNFTVLGRIAPGEFQLEAEYPGEVGNEYSGVLFPINHLDGLGSALLTDVLVYGEEEESDDALRARYMLSFRETRYGGSVTDYIDRVEQIPGVGSCKVYPAWNGGGTVRLVITSSAGGVPSGQLVGDVQQIIDPPGFSGEGKGIAPIGHKVTVAGALSGTVDISFSLVFDDGYTWESLNTDLKAALSNYMAECIGTWANSESIVVRLARIESALLSVRGVLDVSGTTINGATSNLELGSDEIPVLGTVECI